MTIQRWVWDHLSRVPRCTLTRSGHAGQWLKTVCVPEGWEYYP